MSLQGTSFAAPVVTGVVALIVERNPQASARQVREALQRTSTPTSTDLGPWVDPFAAASVVISSARTEDGSPFIVSPEESEHVTLPGRTTRGALFGDESLDNSQLASSGRHEAPSVVTTVGFVALPLVGIMGALGIVCATSLRCRRRR